MKHPFCKISSSKKGVFLAILSAFFISIGVLMWKIANGNLQLLLGGLFFYGLSALLMINAYNYGSLSVIQPLNSVSYIFALLLGKIFLSENVSALQFVGIGIILIGTILIGGGEN